MNKRIVICADGSWNRPEKDFKVDFPTNVRRSLATLHDSRRHFYRIKQTYLRPLDPNKAPILLHRSVKERWE